MELYAVLAVLLMALQLIVAMRAAQPTQVVTPEQVEHIIERVVDHMERQAPPEAPPTTARTPPDCD